MIGKTISHYRILEKLGEGGMGVVYKAQDLKLERFVALKFLSPYLGRDDEEKERFIHEAKAASGLEHNHICTIHEIDETLIENRDQMFIVMAYYDGETLNQKIKKKPLGLEEAVSIAIHTAQGLARAHEANIIHRDIKPGNIIITERGEVKILDFGLAKLAGQSEITKVQTTLGTVAYMSPEQANTEDVDHRTDIWSLGVVLYEMITGERPFRGAYEQSVVYSIMNEDPEPITIVRAGIPEELELIIQRAMAKRLNERYGYIEEMLSDLKQLLKHIESGSFTEESSKESKPSIAVLPFVNMSPQQDQEYFCDGMAEEIINALSQIKSLHVVARTSAFSFKGEKADISEIGKKLKVEHVLEGSVRKAGNRVRITAQLVKVADGYHIWSEKYDRNMEDIFDIQDEISLAIVENLKVKLLGEKQTAVVKRYTDNLEAYHLYLKGRFFSEMLTPEGFEKANECFELALTEDENYAQVYTGLGLVQLFITLFGNISPNEIIPKIRMCAEKALEIDDTISEAHCLLAFCYMSYDWNWPSAEKALKQALILNPNSSLIHVYHSVFLTFIERHDEAIAAAKRARERDPLSDFINYIFGQALYIAGHTNESIKDLQKSLTMNPNYFPLHYTIGYNYRKKSMMNEALEAFEKAYHLSGGLPWTEGLLSITLFEMGKHDRAKALLESLEQRSKREYIPPSILSIVHRIFGHAGETGQCLENAYEAHDSFLCWLRVSPVDTYRIPPDSRLTEKLN